MKSIFKVLFIFGYLSIQGQTIDTTKYLFEAFDQGKGGLAGNCASIALIKSSIACFGINGIYNEQQHGDQVTITLKNGFTLQLTANEISKARANCFFDTSSFANSNTQLANLSRAIYKRAYMTYAVMIKWVMLNGDGNRASGDGCLDSCTYKSFDAALCDLATGINSHQLYYLLGLEEYTTCTTSKAALLDKDYGVIWRGGHTIYTSRGLYDWYNKGTAIPKKWTLFFKNGFYLNKTKTTNRGTYREFEKC